MGFENFETQQIYEVQPSLLDQVETTASEIFSSFGWNEGLFLERTGEYYLDEFKKRETAEFQDARNRFSISTHPELYTFSPENFLPAGPNCLAFAFNLERNPLTGKAFNSKPLPGELSHGADSEAVSKGDEVLYFGTKEEQKEFFKQMLSDDAEALGRNFKEVDADYMPQKGETMIAMVASERIQDNPQTIGDFHFYRKGESGAWLHKPGITDVTDKDSSGNLILNPETCNRGEYDNFLGYYVWKEK